MHRMFDDEAVWNYIVESAARSVPPVCSLLRAITEDADREVRMEAAEALGKSGPAAATPEVVNALLRAVTDDADSGVRMCAAEALGKLGAAAATREVLSALLRAVTDDAESSVHMSAAQALGRLEKSAVTAKGADTPVGWVTCPSLPRFVDSMRNGWAPEDRAHVSSCPSCQNTMSLAWKRKCPDIWLLVQYLAHGEQFEDVQAMRLHLRERDCCWECKLTLRSSWVGAQAEQLSVGKRLGETAKLEKEARGEWPERLSSAQDERGERIKALCREVVRIFFRPSAWALAAAAEAPSVFTSGESSKTAGLTLTDSHGQLTLDVRAMPESAIEQAEIVTATTNRPLPLSWEDDRGLRRAQLGIRKDWVPRGKDCLLLATPALPKKGADG